VAAGRPCADDLAVPVAGPAIAYRRERVDTSDGDFWDFDWLDAPASGHAPLVVLFHGLEGGSDSHYARMLMATLAARGWRGVIPHFRGCSGEPNLLPRAYHSGDHGELEAMLEAIHARVAPATTVYAVGVSVGGSVLLNWLGRKKGDAARVIAGAAAVSTPLDLESAGIAIGRASIASTREFPEHAEAKESRDGAALSRPVDAERIRRVRTMYDFDDAVTSLLHGFDGAVGDARRQAVAFGIGVPTLVLNARNDPFAPSDRCRARTR
jgi:predicted alpha/beta-fold hydrolase